MNIIYDLEFDVDGFLSEMERKQAAIDEIHESSNREDPATGETIH